jgi:transcription elongation factor GreA
MEEFLSNSEVITKNMISKDGRIVFGSWVRLLNQDTDEERKYQIVGEVESNVSEGRLNYKTPFAREILGKRAGDEIEFVTPKGDEQYWEVLDVRYD